MHKLIVPLLILAVLGGGYFALFQAGKSPSAGQTVSTDAEKLIFAAGFPDLAGKRQPLAQWRGQIMVLNFWATWCPPCRLEMPGFIALQEKYQTRGVVFVGLALDDTEKVQAYVRENAVNYPILIGTDEAFELARAIGNQQGGLPFSVLLDRSGKIVAAKVGAWDEKRLESLIEPLL